MKQQYKSYPGKDFVLFNHCSLLCILIYNKYMLMTNNLVHVLARKYYLKKLQRSKKLQQLLKKRLMPLEMATNLLQYIHRYFSSVLANLRTSILCISFLFHGLSICITSKSNLVCILRHGVILRN